MSHIVPDTPPSSGSTIHIPTPLEAKISALTDFMMELKQSLEASQHQNASDMAEIRARIDKLETKPSSSFTNQDKSTPFTPSKLTLETHTHPLRPAPLSSTFTPLHPRISVPLQTAPPLHQTPSSPKPKPITELTPLFTAPPLCPAPSTNPTPKPALNTHTIHPIPARPLTEQTSSKILHYMLNKTPSLPTSSSTALNPSPTPLQSLPLKPPDPNSYINTAISSSHLQSHINSSNKSPPPNTKSSTDDSQKHISTTTAFSPPLHLSQDNIPNSTNITFTLRNTPTFLEFPSFVSTAVLEWLFQDEPYFSSLCTPSEEKVAVASHYLYGQMLKWFRGIKTKYKATPPWEWQEFHNNILTQLSTNSCKAMLTRYTHVFSMSDISVNIYETCGTHLSCYDLQPELNQDIANIYGVLTTLLQLGDLTMLSSLSAPTNPSPHLHFTMPYNYLPKPLMNFLPYTTFTQTQYQTSNQPSQQKHTLTQLPSTIERVARKTTGKNGERLASSPKYAAIDVKIGVEGRPLMFTNIKELFDAIKLLMGPKGTSVLWEHSSEALRTTNEGVTLAKGIVSHERIKHKSSNLGKQTTNASADVVVTNLRSRTWIIYTLEEIIQARTISANEVRQIGKLIAQAIEKVCKEGIITITRASEILSPLQQHRWCEQNEASYKTIADVYGRANLRHNAQDFLMVMQQLGMSTTMTLHLFLLCAYSKAGNAEQCEDMVIHGPSPHCKIMQYLLQKPPPLNYQSESIPHSTTHSSTASHSMDNQTDSSSTHIHTSANTTDPVTFPTDIAHSPHNTMTLPHSRSTQSHHNQQPNLQTLNRSTKTEGVAVDMCNGVPLVGDSVMPDNNATRLINTSHEINQIRVISKTGEEMITDLLARAVEEVSIIAVITKAEGHKMDIVLAGIAQELVLNLDRVGLKMIDSYQKIPLSTEELLALGGNLEKYKIAGAQKIAANLKKGSNTTVLHYTTTIENEGLTHRTEVSILSISKEINTIPTATVPQLIAATSTQRAPQVTPLWNRDVDERVLSESLVTDERKEMRILEAGVGKVTKEKEVDKGTKDLHATCANLFPEQLQLFLHTQEIRISSPLIEPIELLEFRKNCKLALKLGHLQGMAANQLKVYGILLLPSGKSRESTANLQRVYPRGQGISNGGVLLQAHAGNMKRVREKGKKRMEEMKKNHENSSKDLLEQAKGSRQQRADQLQEVYLLSPLWTREFKGRVLLCAITSANRKKGRMERRQSVEEQELKKRPKKWAQMGNGLDDSGLKGKTKACWAMINEERRVVHNLAREVRSNFAEAA